MKDDVTELIVNALTGVCTKCKGHGYIRERMRVSTGFGGPEDFRGSVAEYPVRMCEACDGIGEA